MKLKKETIIIYFLVAIIFSVFIFADTIPSFDNQDNPFNVSLEANKVSIQNLSIPLYAYADEIAISLISNGTIESYMATGTFNMTADEEDGDRKGIGWNGTHFIVAGRGQDKAFVYNRTGGYTGKSYTLVQNFARDLIWNDSHYLIIDDDDDNVHVYDSDFNSIQNISLNPPVAIPSCITQNDTHYFICDYDVRDIDFFDKDWNYEIMDIPNLPLSPNGAIRIGDYFFIADLVSIERINASNITGSDRDYRVKGANQIESLTYNGTSFFAYDKSNDKVIEVAPNFLFPDIEIGIPDGNLEFDNNKSVNSNISSLDINVTIINNILENNCANGTLKGINCLIPVRFFSNITGKIQVNLSRSSIFTNLTVNIYDRETNELITDTVELSIRDYGNYTTNTGILNIDNFSTASTSFSIIADSADYNIQQKDFSFTDKDSTTVDLYLSNSTSSNTGNLIVQVYDDFSNLISESNTKLLEYSAATDSFIEVAQCYTDTNGECIFTIELNEKFYIAQTTKEISGLTFFAQSTTNGQIIKLDNTILPLYLKTTQSYEVDDEFNLIITPSNTDLVGNTSVLTATFNDPSNVVHTVCIGYYYLNGYNEVELTSNCITGSSGVVNVAGGYLLDRKYTNIAKIYTLDGSIKNTYKEYRYPALEEESFFSAYSLWLSVLTLAALLFLLGTSLYLKNMNIFAIGTMVLSPMSLAFNPDWIGGLTMTFIILLCIAIIYFTQKKKEF